MFPTPTVQAYVNARRPEGPAADFIIGNPPFLGNWRMRGELGDGYAETLRSVYSEVPETADYVMYWWHRAAERVRAGQTRRFGFITTNSLRQTFQRRVLTPHLTDASNPASLVFAIPDHPWVDSSDGAAVRIAMTAAEAGTREGHLLRVESEEPGEGEGASKVEFVERYGLIHPDLTVGPNTTAAVPLQANTGLSCPGVKLHGPGFIVAPEKARELGLGEILGLDRHIRQYRNGRDVTSRPRGVMVIDLFGLTAEEVRTRFPAVYQHVFDHVKPERDQNNRPTYRDNWWIHGEPRANFRPALNDLRRYIATVETSKHRFFVFLDASILPDNMLVNIASSDAYVLGVLSSRIHVAWALAAGGRLGFGNDPRYNKTRCFDPFPFPDASEPQRERIRFLGEQLDAHRKRCQEAHPNLTLTEMYNVLGELRAGQPIGAATQTIHDPGLISVLRALHDDLDRAVAEAYGWSPELSTEDILFRLVELNAARAAEERSGLVRWLRPEFQKTTATQAGLGVEMEEEEQQATRASRLPFPSASVRCAITLGKHPPQWRPKSSLAASSALATSKLPRSLKLSPPLVKPTGTKPATAREQPRLWRGGHEEVLGSRGNPWVSWQDNGIGHAPTLRMGQRGGRHRSGDPRAASSAVSGNREPPREDRKTTTTTVSSIGAASTCNPTPVARTSKTRLLT